MASLWHFDRFSVFRINNDKEGYRKQGLTEIGRALKELGIELICANSPQAKGRIERLFQTLQDRLVKEMRLRGICSMEEGNEYLGKYIEQHNAFFAVEACKHEDVHRKTTQKDLDEALCYKTIRKLTKNLELSYDTRIFQIETKEMGYRLVGAHVTIKENLAGDIILEYEDKKLEYKELLVKDHQGKIKNKKEILLNGLGKLEDKAAC